MKRFLQIKSICHSFLSVPLLAVMVLSGCGGKQAEFTWETREQSNVVFYEINTAGVQLITNRDALLTTRDPLGTLLNEQLLSDLTLHEVSSEANGFELYGWNNANQLVQRVVDNNLNLLQENLLYTADSSLTSQPFQLHETGNRKTLSWRDRDRFTYWQPGMETAGQLNESESNPCFALDHNHHYWFLDTSDTSAPVAGEIDLLSGAQLTEITLPAEFSRAWKLAVNDGFIVGVRRNTHTELTDLLIYDRTAQTLDIKSSGGGYGSFDLRLLGQDNNGTIYYQYTAFLAHSGFSAGTHIRAISADSPQQWQTRINNLPIYNNILTLNLDGSGIELMYRTKKDALTAGGEGVPPIKRQIKTNYVALDSAGKITRQLYLQPAEMDVTPFPYPPYYYESVEKVTPGYWGSDFDSDDNGNLFIFGWYEEVDGVDGHYFSGRVE